MGSQTSIVDSPRRNYEVDLSGPDSSNSNPQLPPAVSNADNERPSTPLPTVRQQTLDGEASRRSSTCTVPSSDEHDVFSLKATTPSMPGSIDGFNPCLSDSHEPLGDTLSQTDPVPKAQKLAKEHVIKYPESTSIPHTPVLTVHPVIESTATPQFQATKDPSEEVEFSAPGRDGLQDEDQPWPSNPRSALAPSEVEDSNRIFRPHSSSLTDQSTTSAVRPPNNVHSERWDRLQSMRWTVLASRMNNRERRNELRHRRQVQIENETKILGLLHLFKSSQSAENLQSLVQLMDSSIQAQQEIVRLEDEYNMHEDSLDREEWNLKELERKLYDPESHQPGNKSLISRIGSSSPITDRDEFIDGHSMGSEPSEPLSAWQSHLNDRFLSRQGDLYLVEEDLQELRGQRAHLVEEERARLELHLELDSESKQFLRDFDTRHTGLQEDLKHIQQDLFDIQETINYQSDHLFLSSQFTVSTTQRPPETIDNDVLNDAFQDNTIPLSSHMILDANQPEDPKFADALYPGLMTYNNMQCFINQWLLIDLRRSRLHWLIFRIYLYDYPRLADMSEETLAITVLDHWTQDGTEPLTKDPKELYRAKTNPNKASTVSSDINSDDAARYTTRSQRSDSALKPRAGWRFTEGKDAREKSTPAGLRRRAYQLIKEHSKPKARTVS